MTGAFDFDRRVERQRAAAAAVGFRLAAGAGAVRRLAEVDARAFLEDEVRGALGACGEDLDAGMDRRRFRRRPGGGAGRSDQRNCERQGGGEEDDLASERSLLGYLGAERAN